MVFTEQSSYPCQNQKPIEKSKWTWKEAEEETSHIGYLVTIKVKANISQGGWWRSLR